MRSEYGLIALVYAGNSQGAVQLLLEHGADGRLEDNWEQTALALAGLRGYNGVVELLPRSEGKG